MPVDFTLILHITYPVCWVSHYCPPLLCRFSIEREVSDGTLHGFGSPWLDFTGDFLVKSVSYRARTANQARSTIQLDDIPQTALTTLNRYLPQRMTPHYHPVLRYTTFKAMRLCSHATQRSGTLS